MKPPKPINLTKPIFALVTALSLTAFGADTAYDGGKASNPKDLKGKKVVLADIPKLVGIGYFMQRRKESQMPAPK